ncbi:SprT-like domain-containing protein [Sulfurimonas sp. C5]|uniref:SprT-like domain-containing protein n=1 Tax=Sulfurimonas sp. C5 TaxID=3036947 RepID=UPI002454A914|nr:SprT-like domain-containing protein [Sulfurimonas sp. C5]MDH4945286.1 SprT-like domain-containing protein [Sulfurimonas sp. C5]
MFNNKPLEVTFLFIILFFSSILAYNYYNTYSFKHNPLPQSYQISIKNKENEVLKNMKSHYGFVYKFPLIVTDKLQGKLYGVTAYENGHISIYLNKNVMQESFDYIIDEVIPHEYAHALLMQKGYLNESKQGHSQKWHSVCIDLGGKECKQYVNHEEIINGKLPFN